MNFEKLCHRLLHDPQLIPRAASFLVLLTLVVFWPCVGYDFVGFDDGSYVFENDHVLTGISGENIAWAFTHFHSGNWHPVTWMSHMLDCSMFGLNPAGHHMMNVILHAATVAWLFVALVRLTGNVGRSFFVALVFAIHPLRLESVAWIAERKDVLSGLFFAATLWSYSRYVEGPSRQRYVVVAIFFALGLMSKSMLVTLPCLLLVLDFWPLNRIKVESFALPQFKKLVVEKMPLLALSAAASVAAVLSQHSSAAVAGTELVAPWFRVQNALICTAIYLRKMLWPSDLAVFYPMHEWEIWEFALGTLVVCGITWLAWRSRTKGWLMAGWLWFLGMLVPVIGLVQVGRQAMADRYTYLPGIGVLVAAIWAVCEGASNSGFWRPRVKVIGGGFVLLLLAATRMLMPTWQNSVTLFTRAADVIPYNWLAHMNAGYALAGMGRSDEAAYHYQKVVELNPTQEEAHRFLGGYYLEKGEYPQAISLLETGLKLAPKRMEPYRQLATAMRKNGASLDAVAEVYRKGLRISPTHPGMNQMMAFVLADNHHDEDAVEYFRHAPRTAKTFTAMSASLIRLGRMDEAEAALRSACQVEPTNPNPCKTLAEFYIKAGKFNEANASLDESSRLEPGNPETEMIRGRLCMAQADWRGALTAYSKALSAVPNLPPAMDSIAWVLATAPDDSVRDGARAVTLASRVVEVTGSRMPEPMDTLAAALAETGRYSEAAHLLERAIALSGQKATEATRARLELYRAGKPFRMPVTGSR